MGGNLAGGQRLVREGIKVFNQKAKIINHARGDQQPERGEKFSLLKQIRLARLPNRFGNLGHRGMHRQPLRLSVLCQTEHRADDAQQQAKPHQHRAAGTTERIELHGVERRNFEVGIAGMQRGGGGEE